jgi:hypothetical protein
MERLRARADARKKAEESKMGGEDILGTEQEGMDVATADMTFYRVVPDHEVLDTIVSAMKRSDEILLRGILDGWIRTWSGTRIDLSRLKNLINCVTSRDVLCRATRNFPTCLRMLLDWTWDDKFVDISENDDGVHALANSFDSTHSLWMEIVAVLVT